MSVKLLTEHYLEFLSLTGGCTDSFESIHVEMPHCWKSHATAQSIYGSAHEIFVHVLCRATKAHASFFPNVFTLPSGKLIIFIFSLSLIVRKLIVYFLTL